MKDDDQDDGPEDQGPDIYPEADEIDLGELKYDTLMGDVRDAMLMQFQQRQRPWSLLSEEEQREVAASFELAAKNLVRKSVRLLHAYDFEHVVVTLGEVKVKGKGIEAKITATNLKEYRDALSDHVDSQVMIYLVDSETFMAERAKPRITPDQGSLLPDADAA